MRVFLSCLAVAVVAGLFAANACAQVLVDYPKTLLIQAESFEDKGGWGIDTQSVESVGSPYLIAHGWGKPVADAKMRVEFPEPGVYKVYARTRNWVAPWTTDYAPGRFQIAIDGVKLPTELGTESVMWLWRWQSAGEIEIRPDKLNVEVALCDLTGFDGRVDALLFTADEGFEIPESVFELKDLTKQALRETTIPDAANGKVYDLVVVGGGIAGTCAAISAARLGAQVALVQDRPVLGGNGSSEIRVHLNGDVNLPPYPNLGNLTRQMGPHGGGNAREASHYKDAKRLELVQTEKNIDLYLCYRVDGADIQPLDERKKKTHIKSVTATNIESNRSIRIYGETFADCTGDGTVGYLAGANFIMGRESKKVGFGEPSAPDFPDSLTMGSSVQWNTVETDHETTFPELPWAIQFDEKTIKPSIHGDWDWEAGMDRDQILEMEYIRDLGLRAVYGHWSYMKNHTPKGWEDNVKNRELNWTAYVAGKRESRRLLGDYVLREQDILNAKVFDDASVTTTWSIDLHYPAPDNVKAFPTEQFRAICEQVEIKPYAIPYRCFYSRNVDNLFMAGRDISVSHIALGTVRVMRTGGMMGEVVGMAASICKKHDAKPRDVYEKYLDELKELMKKGVAPAVDGYDALTNPKWLKEGAKNLARDAKVEVDSEYEKEPKYPKEYINDGKFDFSDNAGRWVSAVDDGHWVDFIFEEPVTINAARIMSGQAPGKTPVADFHFMYEKDGKWVDAPGAQVEGNEAQIVGLKFPAFTAKRVRLAITQTPDGRARIWETELYSVSN